MRTASFGALMFALGCSSASTDEPPGGGAGAANGGAMTSSGGAVAAPTGSTAIGGVSGGLSGGASSGGLSSGASSGGTGEASSGGAGKGGAAAGGTGDVGMSGEGGMAGASRGGRGGRSSGGATGSAGTGKGGMTASGGSGGASGCVKNLACKLAAPPSTGDIHQDCVDRINQFLTQCACLPALTRRTDGEACADQMAEYDASKSTAHAGWEARICEPGGSQNSCPGYSSNTQVIGLCLQQMWDEGPPPTSSCTGDCFEQHGHFINMTDKSVTKVACGFYTTSAGKVWAVQNFSR